MRSIGVRELKARASEIIRLVDEDGQSVEVTKRGRVVARLVPASTRRSTRHSQDVQAWLARADRTAEEVGKYWPKGLSAVDAIREDRGAL